MGDKQRKLKDKASRHYADGKLKDALKLYIRVVDEDPTELGCQLKIGDIHRRLNNRDAAVDAYLPVARAYADDGLLLKAIAVCKMIIAVDSDHSAAQALLQELSNKRRGPVSAPAPRPPVTLQGMGISPTASGGAEQFDNYGMVELDPSTSGGDDAQMPGAMRMVDPSELGAAPPAVITGQPLHPPTPAAAPSGGANPWPQPGQTPTPQVGWPQAGQTPTPNVAWPGAAQTPTPEVAWPGAGGQTPPPQVGWPQGAQAPSADAAEPKIIVGERLEDSALDITVGGVTEGERLEDSALDITVGPEILESMGSPPADAKPSQEVLAEQAAREVEAAMAELSGGEASAPAEAADASGDDDALELPPADVEYSDEPVSFDDADAGDDEDGLELNLEDSTDLESAMLAAVAEIDGDAPAASDDEDEPLALDVPIEAPVEAAGPDDEGASPEESPIDLTDVVASTDLRAPVELSKNSEDIDAGVLEGTLEGEELSQTNIPLFSDLPKNAFIELLVQMDMRDLTPGEEVIREGEVGDSFFVLVSGKVRVQRKDDEGQDVVLAYLTEGAFFGEMALLQDGARTATVAAEVDSQIFEISRDVLDRVVSHYPSVANVLRNFYRQRLLSTAMATHPLFRPFSLDERRNLMEQFKSRSFKKGDVLVEEGKKGTGLFLLLYGTLEVVKERDESTPKVLAELASGDLFGEMSLLTGNKTMATVRAISDCFVLRLGKKKFDEIIMTHPQILELVSTISDERQNLNELILAQGLGTGAVLV